MFKSCRAYQYTKSNGFKYMKEKILFKCYSGSKLYGTDNENSDTDIKGVFVPDIKDLIIGKAPKHYQFTTSKNNTRNTKEDIDQTYYSIQYFLELLSKGDTNALDLYFAYTNQKKVIINTPKWKELIENKDKLLTKNMKAYLGYCKSQSIKYSVKGSKLNNFNKFKDFCLRHIYDIGKNGEKLTVKQVLINLFGDFEKYIPQPNKERIKFDKINFGEHCYILTAGNGESYISVSDIKINLNDKIIQAKAKIEKTIESYGKRSENAAKDNGVDYKAISHAVRVSLQIEEILYFNKINFPLKDANFIKSIKYKTTNMSYQQIMDWLSAKIEYIEKELLPNSKLRQKSDFDWINNYILSLYQID